MFVSETYSIEDDYFFDSPSADNTSKYNLVTCEGGSVGTLSYNSNGYYELTNGNKVEVAYLDGIALPTNCILEIECYQANWIGVGVSSGAGYIDMFHYNSSKTSCWRYTNNSWVGGQSSGREKSLNGNQWVRVQLIKQGQSITANFIGEDDTVMATYTQTLQSYYETHDTYIGMAVSIDSGTRKFRNLKIKQL